jgi:putative zinc finger/helix-turn-helix YgiT family protein
MSHECKAHRKEQKATAEKPFHFTGSGLSKVYLVGIKYYTCECGEVTAEIPAIVDLMQLIARDLVMKPTSLVGEEVKFLRKRLGKKQVDFAKAIGVESETLSRYENDKQAISETTDKMIRMFYVMAAEDDLRLEDGRKLILQALEEWKASTGSKKFVAKVNAKNEWVTAKPA